ncbi:MAG TPA: adenylate/guanylate cyclase domain-containing protein [Dongiaceae bacterium]|nr:adenylate/guanylate cyclase domain-containing protein [Dongiaceae bacterium]
MQVAGGSVRDNEPVRKLTTILSADVAEFSRMMRADEDGTFRALRLCRQQIEPLVDQHQGRIFGTAGDSVVAEFASPVEALRCAAEIQQAIDKIGPDLPPHLRMKFRIGINLGDVLIEGDDLIGDGVNIADRIQHVAKPGEICISASVHGIVKNQPEFSYDDLGDLAVKNIAQPVRVYRARRLPAAGIRSPARSRNRAVARAGIWATLAVGAIAAALALALYLDLVPLPAWESGPDADASRSTQVSVAVLPFENLSADQTQDYFVEGITEEMILALGRFSDLSVIAREAVQQYKDKALKPGELSRDLGVRYALQGSVRREDERVRVTAMLSDAQTGVQLWADRYDGEIKDVFAVQDDITQKVVGTLAIKLTDIERQRSLAKPPENLQAYDYAQRARDYFRRSTRADIREARKLFEQAIALDPKYAYAYVGLATTRVVTVASGWTEQTAEALTEAEGLARKALALDGNNAAAHAVLAEVYLSRQQYDLARAEQEQAIALNPNDAWSHAARGGVLVYAGEPQEAVRSFEIALRLDPSMNVVGTYPVGWAYYLVGRYEDGVRVMERQEQQFPSDFFIHAALAASYAQLGRTEDAARAASSVLRSWPFFHVDTFVTQFRRTRDRDAIREGLLKAGLN